MLDGCEIDVAQGELVRGGERVRLTTKELEVLVYFARNPSRSISHEELLERVWGHPRLASTQPVYSVLKRLRKKLDGHGEHRHLHTVHGVGYRFEPPRPARASGSPPLAPVSSFLGRELELAQVADALARGARIVTLVGPGGAGKTRLADELRRGRRVVRCDLSAAASTEEARHELERALGVREAVDPAAALGLALRAREPDLLLLDGAERVVEGVARLAASLAPIAPVVVTSRERLAVPGEHVVEVGPLPREDAARLFVERAQAAGAGPIDPAHVSDVVERLDGLPLAIEIAAAHAGVATLADARAALDRQLDRLSGPRRGVPARHASLRASVEWSWSLLDEAERRVLAQCTVFAGGLTLDAADAVIVGMATPRRHVRALAERSLLRASVGGARARFALYACVRERALEHDEDWGALAGRHARWAHERVQASGALDAVPPAHAYAELAPELDDLRAALEHALVEEPARVADLAIAIELVTARERGPNASGVLERALSVAPERDRLRLRLALGAALAHTGARGLSFLEETSALACETGVAEQRLEADRLVASALVALGEPRAALERLEAALEAAPEHAPPLATVGRLALDLAEAHLAAGNAGRAGELAREASRVLEALGDHAAAARAAGVASHVHRERREHEDALAALVRAEGLLEDAGDEVGLARLALDRGVLLAHLARTAEAESALATAIAAHRRLGLPTGEIRARDWMVLVLLGLGRDDDAIAEARALKQLALDVGRPLYEAERAFGAAWLATGRLDEADAALGRALAMLERGGKEVVRGHVLSTRALARVLAGRLADAEADLVDSVRVHADAGSEAARLHALAELALVREIGGPHDDTDAALDAAAHVTATSWERRHAEGRRAIVRLLRARRAGAGAAALEALATRARAVLAGEQDFFTRCTALLVEHVARA